MNLDILLKTRNYTNDYSWFFVPNYISQNTLKNIDDFIGNIYNNTSFRNSIKKAGKNYIYTILDKEYVIVSRFAYSEKLDIAGRNIYAYEGICLKKDDFLLNSKKIINILKNSEKLLRDIFVTDDMVAFENTKTIDMIELLNLTNIKSLKEMLNDNPYKYLEYRVKNTLDNATFVIVDSEYNLDDTNVNEIIYLNKDDYKIPDEVKYDEKSKIDNNDVDMKVKDIINFFNKELVYNIKETNNELYFVCIFNLYKGKKAYEYKIKLVNFNNKNQVLFETLPKEVSLYGISTGNIKDLLNDFINHILTYGFSKEEGLLLKYEGSNIDKVLKDTIIIKQRCNIEIRKNEIYAIPPILKVVSQYKMLKQNYNIKNKKANYKLKNFQDELVNVKSNNIFSNLFSKKNVSKNVVLRYKSKKWTDIVY